MSLPPNPPPFPPPDVTWSLPGREALFARWLADTAAAHGLQPATLRIASADASFRRYLRIDSVAGTRIVMDAPPSHEDCRPFVQVARLMAEAGLNVPEVLAWDEAAGFMLLSDLGTRTMIVAIDAAEPASNLP